MAGFGRMTPSTALPDVEWALRGPHLHGLTACDPPFLKQMMEFQGPVPAFASPPLA